jgi:Transcriptional regulator containing an amidase domain and an AraC-type DNA-binding HTH domain
MGKKVAVIAVNPVNGSGLFQYLEAFYENKIPYKTFAIDTTKDIKTNSGISISLDGVIADLKGEVNEFDAILFSCGDAMIPGAQNNMQAMGDALALLATFDSQNKIIIGHCASAIMFDKAGIINGKKVALHPLAKAAIANGIATDDHYMIDQNVYTAQEENNIHFLLPELLKVLQSV